MTKKISTYYAIIFILKLLIPSPQGTYSPASNVLLSATVPIVDYQRCNTSYGLYLDQGMICAGDYINGGKDACQVNKRNLWNNKKQ